MIKERSFLLFSFLLAILIILVLGTLILHLNETKESNEQTLVNEAILHYENIKNTRKWNAHFGGVYVKPRSGITPNPYLKENILKVDENLSLIKINPAWMTRQLSEISTIQGFSFRLTSLKPINPVNRADTFETEALRYFEKNRDSQHYYQIDDSKRVLRFAGALVTKQACLNCHAVQGYQLGDIRGAVSITLSTKSMDIATLHTQRDTLFITFLFTAIIIFIITIFLKQLKQKKAIESLNTDLERKRATIESFNEELEQNVQLKTAELSAVLDSQSNIILVTNEKKLLAYNKAFTNFFSEELRNKFLNRESRFCDHFIEREGSFTPEGTDLFWAVQIMQKPIVERVITLADLDGKEHTFSVTVNPYAVDEEYFVISLNDVTSLTEESRSFEHLASFDHLTDLLNRRKFAEFLQQEISRCERYGHPLSAIMFDIDFFKKINDKHGHAIGDQVLVTLAQHIREKSREQDITVRWGGEEFIILLPHTNLDQAHEKAELLRNEIEILDKPSIPHFTISLGVATFHPGESDEDFLKRLDNALYEAKNSGRNQVVIKT